MRARNSSQKVRVEMSPGTNKDFEKIILKSVENDPVLKKLGIQSFDTYITENEHEINHVSFRKGKVVTKKIQLNKFFKQPSIWLRIRLLIKRLLNKITNNDRN